MVKFIIAPALILLFSCTSSRSVINTAELSDTTTSTGTIEMPTCLVQKIQAMTADPNEGSPISVSRYLYNDKIVYYMVSPCCDKYNVVYDSACNVLGFPDGGFTGRGDGKMTDFRKVATDEKVIWIGKRGT